MGTSGDKIERWEMRDVQDDVGNNSQTTLYTCITNPLYVCFASLACIFSILHPIVRADIMSFIYGLSYLNVRIMSSLPLFLIRSSRPK